MARLIETYRGARRNAARLLHTLRDWYKGPHWSLSHQTKREHPVLNKNTGLPEVDKKTGKTITEWIAFVAVQVVHQSYALTTRPA